jgi:hypothetical protein
MLNMYWYNFNFHLHVLSRLDRIIGIFHWHNPSGRTMALRSTQPVIEMNTRSMVCGVKAVGA